VEVFDPASTRVGSLKKKKKKKLLYDWRFTANQFVWASSPLKLMTRIFFPN
jgi:hypothetical protein